MAGPVFKVVFPDEGCKLFRGSQVDFKGLEIPVVDPIIFVSVSRASSRLFPAVHLYKGSNPFSMASSTNAPSSFPRIPAIRSTRSLPLLQAALYQ